MVGASRKPKAEFVTAAGAWKKVVVMLGAVQARVVLLLQLLVCVHARMHLNTCDQSCSVRSQAHRCPAPLHLQACLCINAGAALMRV